MTLQNRVHPDGSLHAVTARGSMMGNRGGKFHREDRTLSARRWASHHWICCELAWKGAHHEPMGPGYTSLFFLDEVTALAAGHRPCFFCRRSEAKRFVQLSGMGTEELDRVLHGERVSKKHPFSALRAPFPQQSWGKRLGDGVMIESDGEVYAVRGDGALVWTFEGYVKQVPLHAISGGRVLTPRTIMGILASGYQPRWHPSAQQWERS